MYKVHHGLALTVNAENIPAVLGVVEAMLKAGYRNILVSGADADVTGSTDWDNQPAGRTGTIKLEIPILP